MPYAKTVQNLACDKAGHGLKIFRVVIKGRNRRGDRNSEPGELQHVFEMNCAEGHFTRGQQKMAAFP